MTDDDMVEWEGLCEQGQYTIQLSLKQIHICEMIMAQESLYSVRIEAVEHTSYPSVLLPLLVTFTSIGALTFLVLGGQIQMTLVIL